MSTLYITPQRIQSGHLSRFLRRASAGPAAPSPPLEAPVSACFETQTLQIGERREVFAQYASEYDLHTATAVFTLFAIGEPVANYNAVGARVTADPSPLAGGRLITVSALIDLSPTAPTTLYAGIYTGRFLLTSPAGQLIAAEGPVEIRE